MSSASNASTLQTTSVFMISTIQANFYEVVTIYHFTYIKKSKIVPRIQKILKQMSLSESFVNHTCCCF